MVQIPGVGLDEMPFLRLLPDADLVWHAGSPEALEFQAAPGLLRPALVEQLQHLSGEKRKTNDIIEAIASFSEGRWFGLSPPRTTLLDAARD